MKSIEKYQYFYFLTIFMNVNFNITEIIINDSAYGIFQFKIDYMILESISFQISKVIILVSCILNVRKHS